MSISRIYQPSTLVIGETVLLDEEPSHHLARVLRAKIGDTVTVFNGLGGEYPCDITEITKRNVTVRVLAFSPREAESNLNLCLAQGISRGEKMDYTIQKAVELGVTHIVPLLTERCTVKLDEERREKRLKHWQSIIIGAAEQSGRNRIPTLTAPQSFSQGLQTLKADQCFILSPFAEQKLQSTQLQIGQSIVLLIGPEGGFSKTEIEQANRAGFIPLNLGPRILRTETAAVAAITLLQSHFGDMG